MEGAYIFFRLRRTSDVESQYSSSGMLRVRCTIEIRFFSFFLNVSHNQGTGILMTDKHVVLCHRLQRLGFTQGNQMKLYGEVYEFLSEPIVMTDDVILLDATERKTGQRRRVRVPLPIINMASADRSAA